MQKQKIELNLYLAIQSSYENIEIALYNHKKLLEKIFVHKLDASRDLIPRIDTLLTSYDLKPENLTFIAVNKGPGPFTTLRVVISTVNALNFAINLPLIGIDGLDAIIEEFKSYEYPVTIALLNAFNNDVYYAIKSSDFYEKGWSNIEEFLMNIKERFSNQKIQLLGNGVDLFKDKIKNILGDFAFIKDNNPQTCSIEIIAKLAYQKWENKEDISEKISPLYIKEAIRFKKEL